jgi:hypothetical protein
MAGRTESVIAYRNPYKAPGYLKKILFLGTGNSCRSQIAEAWRRHLKNDLFEPHSVGMEPSALGPRTIKALAEEGINIEIPNEFDKVGPDSMVPEAPLGHLPDRLFLGPAADRHPIHGTHEAGTVGAVLAVHEYRLTAFVSRDLSELKDRRLTTVLIPMALSRRIPRADG